MAVEQITNETKKGKAIVELQSLKSTVVAGTTAVTNIAVSGIKTTDTIQSVIMFAAGVPSDVTTDASITSAGNIQLATVDSTGNTLLVSYFVKPV